MRLTGVSRESGATGLSVSTTLTNPSTRPGLRLSGRVMLSAGSQDVPVRHVRLGLVATAEPEDPRAPRSLVQYHQVTVGGRFVVPAGRRRAIDFAVPLPWETPVTIFGGVPLMSLRTGLRTEVSVDPELEQGAMVPIFVHPLPTQQHVLAALDTLGFVLRQVGLVSSRLPGVAQSLPVHERLGYWVAPLYAGPITELELIFVTNSAGLEVLLWMDRRLSLTGISHQSISRFRIWHTGADQQDWVVRRGRLAAGGDQPARGGGLERTLVGPDHRVGARQPAAGRAGATRLRTGRYRRRWWHRWGGGGGDGT